MRWQIENLQNQQNKQNKQMIPGILSMRPENSFFHRGFVEYCNFLKKHRVSRVLEIGAYVGESALLFKQILGQDTIVISIDPFADMPDSNDILQHADFSKIESKFNENTANLSNYGKLKFYSQEIGELFADNFFDCVYVDGLHTYEQVKTDIAMYLPKVRSGGIISGHDFVIPFTPEMDDFFYHPDGVKALQKEVSKAVLEFFQPDSLHIFQDSSWATIKK